MRFVFILFLFVTHFSFSQFGFDKIEHDFGEIFAGNERMVDVKFRNTTSSTVYLLRIQHGYEIKSLVSGKKIEPDSLLTIRLKYNPSKKGKFKVKIPIYLSNSLDPFVFTLQGDIKEIDNSIGLECPSFENKIANPTPIFDFTATVIDKETGKRVEGAIITFISNGTISKIEKTNKQGQVKTVSLIGLYYFVIQAEGYFGKEFQKYVNKNNDTILVYLSKPVEKENLIVEKEPAPIEELIIDKEPEVVQKEEEIEGKEPEIIERSFPIIVEEKSKDTTPIMREQPVVEPVIRYKYNNIVFLLDVSTSMKAEGKLDLLKSSLIAMVKELRAEDRITLISYSTFSKIIVEGASGDQKEKLIKIIQGLKAQGMTAGGDGMKLGYREAKQHFIDGGNNQVIMATDGKFNQGNTSLDRLVKKNFAKGIGLTVLGIKNKPNDAEDMQEIASLGGGNFLLINNYEDSQQILIQEIKRTSRIVE